jgi:hypothetical protein
MNTTVFSAYEWLQLIALGGLAGLLGQGIRVVVGFKKLHDASNNSNTSVYDMIKPDRLFVPLAVGFIAGALAACSTISALSPISGQQILALAAAGYSAADFIEGFMSRVAPAANVPAGQESVGVGTSTTTDDTVG